MFSRGLGRVKRHGDEDFGGFKVGFWSRRFFAGWASQTEAVLLSLFKRSDQIVSSPGILAAPGPPSSWRSVLAAGVKVLTLQAHA